MKKRRREARFVRRWEITPESGGVFYVYADTLEHALDLFDAVCGHEPSGVRFVGMYDRRRNTISKIENL